LFVWSGKRDSNPRPQPWQGRITGRREGVSRTSEGGQVRSTACRSATPWQVWDPGVGPVGFVACMRESCPTRPTGGREKKKKKKKKTLILLLFLFYPLHPDPSDRYVRQHADTVRRLPERDEDTAGGHPEAVAGMSRGVLVEARRARRRRRGRRRRRPRGRRPGAPRARGWHGATSVQGVRGVRRGHPARPHGWRVRGARPRRPAPLKRAVPRGGKPPRKVPPSLENGPGLRSCLGAARVAGALVSGR